MDDERATETHVTSDMGSFAMLPLWVLEAGASPRAIQLLGFLLAKFADRKMECYPSRRTIAELMNTSLDTVDRTMKELRDLGVIETEERHSPNGGYSASLIHIRLARPNRTPAATSGQECGEVAATVRRGSRMDAGTRTIPIEPDPMNHTADALEPLPLFGDGQPAPPPSKKKTRRTAQSAHQDSNPVIRTPAAVPLREATLAAIREEFRDLPDLQRSIDRCMEHISYRTSTNKPGRLREWLAKDRERMAAAPRGAQSAQSRDPRLGPMKNVPYWEQGCQPDCPECGGTGHIAHDLSFGQQVDPCPRCRRG